MILNAKIYKLYIPLLGFLSLLVSLSFYNTSRKSVIWADAEGYYSYLPAVFIFNGFEDVPSISGQLPKYEGTDKTFTKFTWGVAFLELPFFLAAQFVSFILDKDTGGYASLNNLSLRIAAIFYGMAGLYILKRLLERYFSRTITLVSIILIYAATNLFYYTVQEAGMSHVYSFFLFTVFIWLTHLFYQEATLATVIKLGLVYGLIILIRPTNAVLLLYFLFYEVYSFKDLRARITFLLQKVRLFLIVPVLIFLVFIPQFMYWKYISGNFLIYSYTYETFKYWKDPKVINILFDIKNGWILYTPLVIFMLIGVLFSIKNKKVSSPVIGLIAVWCVYIFSSWWNWWFGGALGYRSFVEFYALLIFPLAYLLVLIGRKRFLIKTLTAVIFTGCILYNIGVTYLYVYPWRHPDWNLGNFEYALRAYFPASPDTF